MKYFLALIVIGIAACGPKAGTGSGEDGGSNPGGTQNSSSSGSSGGVVPQGLPSRLTVGLFEDVGMQEAGWMQSSGVAWDLRYQYLVKGWADNFGFGSHDGTYALWYMQDSAAHGFIPAFMFYQVNGEPPAYDESQFYVKTTQPSVMADYFGDFKLLMQRAKDYGKPVLVMVEGDGFAYMQIQSQGKPDAYAAVADSGLTELSGLPNTVAGWGLAFLQIRKAVGADNVILGVDVSDWATLKDLLYVSVTDSLGPEVDQVYGFLKQLGLGPNVTGATFDVTVNNPLDRDADYYRLNGGGNKWWDTSNAAPIDSMSFNRYAEWLRLWHVASGKPWILWQIPLGNSNHLDVANNGGSREGYKDNRPEYFFLNGTSHLQKFANVGVISLLFGAGQRDQSSYQNDTYTDGKLFMQSRAGNYIKSGEISF